MKKLEALLKKTMNLAIDKDEDNWPPVCLGIFHQPERPIAVAVPTEKKSHAIE